MLRDTGNRPTAAVGRDAVCTWVGNAPWVDARNDPSRPVANWYSISGPTFSPYFPAAMSATSCARSFFADAHALFRSLAGVHERLHHLTARGSVVRSHLVLTSRPL